VNPVMRTDNVVRLHTGDNGLVWLGTDNDLGKETPFDTKSALDDKHIMSVLSSSQVVRIVGTQRNAPLICRLYELQYGGGKLCNTKVLLFSPDAVCNTDDVASTLDTLWRVPDSSRLSGHFHEMDKGDYIAYSLIKLVATEVPGPVSRKVRRLVPWHPAWPACTFVRSLDVSEASRLLCDIIDPRWYRHLTHPGRFGRLYRSLGVTKENVHAFIYGKPGGKHFDRAKTAIRTWYNDGLNKNANDCSNFLAVYLRKYPLPEAVHRGTQKLIEFIATFWLDSTRAYHPELGFDAGRFFKHTVTAREFAGHLISYKRN